MPGGGLCLTRPTHPALIVCRPAQAQRRRARTAGTEPILCRVAAVALPGLQPLPFESIAVFVARTRRARRRIRECNGDDVTSAFSRIHLWLSATAAGRPGWCAA
ncbi:hypothetical protein CWN23_22330 [Klebsiella pneumoniae]|nr:hypothetical protein CWN31_19880 [Klebsiella pneumoniae]PLM69542.1 hypothetical protein CWN23_22330 [Klebsiella pneumoniae]